MFEIVLLFLIGKYLAGLVRRSGRKPGAWIAALIVGWFGCEIVASLAAGAVIYLITQKPPHILALLPFALLGGGAFGWLLCRVAKSLPPLEGPGAASMPPPLPDSAAVSEPEVELPIAGWFLAIAGKKSGPFSLYQIREKYQRGEIADATLYWLPEEENWQPIGKIARHFDQG